MGAHPGSAPSPIVRLGAPLCWALDASPCLCQGRFRWRQRAPRQRLTAFVPWSTWPVSWPATVPNNLLSSRCGLHLVLPLPVPTCLCIAATHLPFCWSGSPFVPLPLQAMPTYFGARFNHQAGRTGGMERHRLGHGSHGDENHYGFGYAHGNETQQGRGTSKALPYVQSASHPLCLMTTRLQ
jgi:hypothetical protein